jgi:hypothetical protein
MHLLDPSADAPGETRQVVVGQREHAMVPGEGGELLLLAFSSATTLAGETCT